MVIAEQMLSGTLRLSDHRWGSYWGSYRTTRGAEILLRPLRKPKKGKCHDT